MTKHEKMPKARDLGEATKRRRRKLEILALLETLALNASKSRGQLFHDLQECLALIDIIKPKPCGRHGMTDAPERIWATVDIDISAQTTDIYAQDTPDGFVGNPVEYTRADIPVKVKPMVWHRSHINSWNHDFHTTGNLQYVIRCADENGWKWTATGQGAFGYCNSPEEAKAAAQSDYETRIRECIEQPAPPEEDGQFVSDESNIEGNK